MRQHVRAPPSDRSHAGAQPHALGRRGDRGEHGPGICRRRSPGEREVVPDEDPVPPGCLGGLRDPHGYVGIGVGPEVRETDRVLHTTQTRVPRRGVHDATRAARDVRHGRVHALARFGRRHGGLGTRRQRVRRSGRGRLHAPGRRAAPERAGRGGPGALLLGRSRRAADPLRSGSRSRRGDDRTLPRARLRLDSRHGRARGLRSRCVRRLAAAAAGIRHLVSGGGARLCDRLRGQRLPGRRGHASVHRAPGGPDRRLAGFCRASTCRCPSSGRSSAIPCSRRRTGESSQESAGGSRDAADRARARALLRGVRRRRDSPLLRSRKEAC